MANTNTHGVYLERKATKQMPQSWWAPKTTIMPTPVRAQHQLPAAPGTPAEPAAWSCSLPLMHKTQFAELESNPKKISIFRSARDWEFILKRQHHARNACFATSSAQPLIPKPSHQRAQSRAEVCTLFQSLSPAHGQALPRQKQPCKSFGTNDGTRTRVFICPFADPLVDPTEGFFSSFAELSLKKM